MDEFKIIASLRSPSIVCVTETWLSSSVDSSLVTISGYNVCRDDRSFRRGGGTAVYVRSDLDFKSIGICDLHALGCNCVCLDLPYLQLLVICVYIPPNLLVNDLREVRSALVCKVDDFLSLQPNYSCVFLGDFNQFDVASLCSELDLIDIICQPTRKNSILDHILISKQLQEEYSSSNTFFDCPLGKSDHLMITCLPNSQPPTPINFHLTNVLDLRDSNMLALVVAASKINWSELVSSEQDVDAQWEAFHTVLKELVDSTIPTNTVLMSDRDKAWMTPLTKYLIQEKWKAYRSHQWPKYLHLRDKVKEEIKRAKCIWADKLKLTTNGLWKLLRCTRDNGAKDAMSKIILSEKGGIPSLMNELRTKLSASFSVQTANSDTSDITQTDNEWRINITEHDVHELLSKVKSSKSPGHDGILTRIYRSLADHIALPLSIIFQTSVYTGMVPSQWKKGVMVPIPKTNPPSKEKLRFITLLPLPLKLLERIVLKSTWPFFQKAYGPEQHGFRRGSSTTTAILQLIDSASRCMNEPSLFGAALVSFDLSQAFDNVDCQLALRKLRDHGFPEVFVHWLSDYFANRTASIKIKGEYSGGFPISRGVPQGSVLGPPIFCAYVHDIVGSQPEITTIKYADDINLVIPLPTSNEDSIRQSIDTQTEHIRRVCSEFHLPLNAVKSKVLIVSRRPVHFTVPPLLPVSSQLRVLGVVVDNKLKWNAHIAYVCNRVAQRLHIIRKLKPMLSYDELHLVYTSIIRSLIEYCSPVFVGLTRKLDERLRKVDRRAHRIMANFVPEAVRNPCDCTPMITTERRLAISKKLFMFIESKDHILRSLLPQRLHYSNLISVPFASHNSYYNSFFPFMARYINSLQQ